MSSRSPSRGERFMSHSSGHCKQGMPNFGSRSALGTADGVFSPSLMRKQYVILCIMTRAK